MIKWSGNNTVSLKIIFNGKCILINMHLVPAELSEVAAESSPEAHQMSYHETKTYL